MGIEGGDVGNDNDASSVGTDFMDDGNYAGFLSFLRSPAAGCKFVEDDDEKIDAVPKEESDVPLVAWYDMIMGNREGAEEA